MIIPILWSVKKWTRFWFDEWSWWNVLLSIWKWRSYEFSQRLWRHESSNDWSKETTLMIIWYFHPPFLLWILHDSSDTKFMITFHHRLICLSDTSWYGSDTIIFSSCILDFYADKIEVNWLSWKIYLGMHLIFMIFS